MKLDNNNLSLRSIFFDLLLLMFILLPAVQALSDSFESDNRGGSYPNISISESQFPENPVSRHLDPNNQRIERLSNRSGIERMSVLAASDVNITRVGNFGGTTEAVDVSGNYAYTGQGSDKIRVISTTNPAYNDTINKNFTISAQASINIIQNPGFESETTSWRFFTSGTGSFTTPSPGYEGTKAAKLAMGSSGTNIQLYQTGATLEPNMLYRLSFAAYSTSGHDMKVKLFKHVSPYTNYGLDQTFNLNTNWQTFSIEFTTKGFTGTVNDGRFQFWLVPFVTGADTYYIDDVRLEKVSVPLVRNINKGTNYTTIQAAIDDASPGDEIHVENGTYIENVNVTKRLILRGIGMPVVDAGGSGSAITLSADGITLEGFTATGTGYEHNEAGIMVMSNNNILNGNNANKNGDCWDYAYVCLGTGISLSSSSNNTLIGNNASDNYEHGIYLSYSSNNMLFGNNANSIGYCWEYVCFGTGISLTSSINNTLIGNNASDNYEHGIALWFGSSNNTLIGNNANSNGYCDDQGCLANAGISLWDSSNNTLSSNTVGGNNYGILLSDSSNNTLSSNTAMGNIYGIFLRDFGKNKLINNIMEGNSYNFGVERSYNPDFDNLIDTTNLVDGKPVFYINGATDIVYDSYTNAGTFYCISCVNVTLKNLDLKHNSEGIFLWNTTNSKIQNITASNNFVGISMYFSSNNTLISNNANKNVDWFCCRSIYGIGISLYDSSNNTLISSNANENGGYGISLDYSSNNTLISNNANSNNDVGISLSTSINNTLIGNNASSNNWHGIFLLDSSNNKIYHNNLINNDIHASDDSNSNLWDNGYPSGGNSWSDYTGMDLKSGPGQDIPGSDGIGDTPYNISGGGGAQDRYPLMTSTNLISNPGFEFGTSSWIFYTNGKGKFTAVPPGYEGNNSATIAINSSSTNIQLYQKDITLEPNTQYRLSFAAYSTTGHDVTVKLVKHISPFTPYGLAQTFNLGTNWQEYSVTFTTTGFSSTVNNGRLMFNLVPFAAAGDKYYIDNVRLSKV